MALIKCPECGHQVSDKANACPNCGCPIIQATNQSKLEVNHPTIAKPVTEPKWVNKYRTKTKKRNTRIIISWIVLIALSILFTLLLCFDKEVVHYTHSRDSYYAKTVWIMFTCFGWSALFIDFVVGCIVIAYGNITVEYHNNHTIVLYEKIGTPKLVIDDVVCKFAIVKTHLEAQEFTYKFPDGELMVITAQGKNKFFDYHYPSGGNVQNQIIINNVEINIIKKGKQSERSDMEKILIKNAKIDALASIDPTNTKKAKEQIDIVNKLDNLD